METLLVITHCPDEETANAIALAAIDAKLAACVTILPRVQAIYRWQGRVASAHEIPLHFKTTAAIYPSLEVKIRELHPYELPEIIALPLSHGLPAYLNWVAAETTP